MSRGPGEEFQPRLWATIIALAAIAIYLVAFIYKNSGQVTLHFIFFSAHVGLIWLLLERRVSLILAGPTSEKPGVGKTIRDPALIRNRFMKGLGTGRGGPLDA